MAISPALGTALSALKAFDIKLDVNANNIANFNTNDFRKSRVEMQEAGNGGVEVKISQSNSPGVEVDPNPRTGAPQQSSNLSLEEEFVDQVVTQYSYTANMLTVKTADEMQKELMDIKA
jgi:flagellar basal-body rod protein FlgC